MKPNILITGATGHTALPLIERLSSEGVAIRGLVHSPHKKSMIEKYKGVEAVVGDYADRASLELALKGIEKVYLVSPSLPDQVRLLTNFVNIARLNGVKHIVKLSALGTATESPVGLLRMHAEIENHISKSGMAYTFLRPHFFMENLLGNVATVRKDGAIYSPLGETGISMVSVVDIAAVAARTLTGKGHEGKIYTITGPEAVTYDGIARALSTAIHKPVAYVPVSFEAAKQGMIQMGMPEWIADDLVRLMKTWIEGKGSQVSPDVEKITGKKPISIEEFFRIHRSMFLEAA